MMRPTIPRHVNRMRVPVFDQTRFRPAFRTLLSSSDIVGKCSTHIPSGYSLRKRKQWEYFVLDERQQVAGLLRPIPASPFPEIADHGSVNVESYLHQQSSITQDFKSFVTVWHRAGASVCTVSASPSAEFVTPLKEFYSTGKFDGLQSHKSVNLMHHGATAAFFDAFFSYASSEFSDHINPCQQFLKLATTEGFQMFTHARRAYREDYQPHCQMDPNDPRWVEVQLGSQDVNAMLAGNTLSGSELQRFLRTGSLWMDTDITKKKD
jgi:hypothetical protein